MRPLRLRREQTCQGPLVLIDRAHPLQEGAPPELVPVDRLHPQVLLERRAARLLAACIRSVGGGRAIVPVSGWRSRAEQQAIWDDTRTREGDAFTRQYVALPGCSEHQTGLAIDLGEDVPDLDFIRPSFPDSGACGAFRRAAARYGFLQRYCREKEALTGIAAEPWHFRYVGAPHAQLMEEHGLCLEEYVPFLEVSPRLCRLGNGRTARVSRLPCPSAVLELEPPAGCWQLSGDNCGGFILTVWEGEP